MYANATAHSVAPAFWLHESWAQKFSGVESSMLENNCNSSTGEAVAGEFQVQGQPDLEQDLFSTSLLGDFSREVIFTPEKVVMWDQRNDSVQVRQEPVSEPGYL